jgi:hypothetical protein
VANLLTVSAFHKISETGGSGPLLCTLSDGEEYYCKKNNKLQKPYTDLINEVFVNGVLKQWGISAPEICLVNFDFSLFQSEIENDFNRIKEKHRVRISNHYIPDHFSYPLFGSKKIFPSSGLPGNSPKGSFNLFNYENPEDILLIGFLDLWVANHDRKPTNSNIILSQTETRKLKITAIDNCQAFDKSKNYNDLLLTTPLLKIQDSILSSGFSKQIAESLTIEQIDNIKHKAITFVQKSLTLWDDLFIDVPFEWGLLEGHKKEMQSFLSNPQRISDISETFKSYLIT